MGVTLGQVANGAGRHAAYLQPPTIRMGLKLNYIGQVIFLWAPCMVKVSIGLFLLRVTPDFVHRKIIYGAMSFILAWTLACFITLLLQCDNIRAIWDDSVQTVCWSVEVIHALGWASAGKKAFKVPFDPMVSRTVVVCASEMFPDPVLIVVSITSDIFFATLPIAILWKLQINTRRKMSLVALMSLGIL